MSFLGFARLGRVPGRGDGSARAEAAASAVGEQLLVSWLQNLGRERKKERENERKKE